MLFFLVTSILNFDTGGGRSEEQRVLHRCAREDVVSAALVQDKCGAAVASFQHAGNR